MVAHVFDRFLEPRQDPLVRRFQLFGAERLPLVHIHQHEAAGIPYLIGKVPGSLHFFPAVPGIVSGADAHHEAEAERVGAVLFHNLQRIHTVAQ